LNKSVSHIAAVLFVFFIHGSVRAADAVSQNVPVNLAEAVEMAIKARPELRAASEKTVLARIKVDEAKGAFFPTLDITGSNYYIHSYDTFTGIDVSTKIYGLDLGVRLEKEVPPWQLVPKLEFNYNLFAGGRDKAILKAAENATQSADYAQEVVRRKIVLEVANAYWELKKAQVVQAVANRAVGLVHREVSVAKAEREVNRLSDSDEDAMCLKKQEKEMSFRTADRDVRRAFDHYRHVLGLPKIGLVEVKDEIPALIDSPEDSVLPADRLTAHPDILRLGSELRQASQQKQAAIAAKYPKVDFFAKYAMIGRGNDSLYDSWAESRSDFYAVGVQVSMNLYDGHQTSNRIREAETVMRLKEIELALKERELTEAYDTRLAALEWATDQLSLVKARQLHAAAREKADLSRLRSGRISDLAYRQSAADAADATDKVELARIQVALARNALELMVLQ
jgi:outer membrane protein, adhesin transport system